MKILRYCLYPTWERGILAGTVMTDLEQLHDDNYAGLALSLMTPGQEYKALHIKDGAENPVVSYSPDENGQQIVSINMPPDGEQQHWRQVMSEYDPETGFRGSAFVRVALNEEGEYVTYQDENGQPEVKVVIPGRTESDIDRELTDKILDADRTDEYFASSRQFVTDLNQTLVDENLPSHPEIDVMSYSQGIRGGVAVNHMLQSEYNYETNHLATEEFAGGEALQAYTEWVQRTNPDFADADAVSIVDAARPDISIRTDDPTIFSELAAGNQVTDNQMTGRERYTINTLDRPDWKERAYDHSQDQMMRSQMAFGHGAIVPFDPNTQAGPSGFWENLLMGNNIEPDQAFTSAEILEGGEDISTLQKFWSGIKEALYNAYSTLFENSAHNDTTDPTDFNAAPLQEYTPPESPHPQPEQQPTPEDRQPVAAADAYTM